VELARSIATSLELDPILQVVAGGARELCRCDLSAIALREPDSGAMVFRHRAGERRHEGERLVVLPGRGAGGLVLSTGQPVRSDDVSVDPRFAGDVEYLAAVDREKIATVMVVPIVIGAQVEGLLYVDNRTPRPFSDRDEAILRQLADHAAIAIRNAQLLAAAQRARAEAENANRMKDEFLATLSHELRTPLNAILGWAVTLRTARLDGAAAARALEAIERNARAQSQLIEDLLDISRIVNGKLRLDLRLVDLRAVVEAALDAVHPAARAKSIELVPALDPRAGAVQGDPHRLQQVAWNLLTNAIKFTPRGGRIDVGLARVDASVELTVRDTGQGIAPRMLPFVFDRFRQADSSSTRRQGLGIGLALVKNLTELHGGQAKAESAGVGQGATFRVRLPLHGSAAGTETLPPRHALPPGPVASIVGVRILVVDDDHDSLELVAGVLTRADAEVRTARSADEAFRVLAGWRADVVVTDIEMPGDDGVALLRRLRALPVARGGAAPAVALTAHGGADDGARLLADGFEVHVAKPVEPADLVAVVARVARSPRAA
jgi:signal transduction histidine kinase